MRSAKLQVIPTLFLAATTCALCSCGITPASGPSVQQNLPVPTLVNNVPKPRDASLALQDYCGNLGVIQGDGTIETLRIPVYPADSIPKLVVPAQSAQADFQSLLDQTAATNLSLTYGAATGSYTMSGEDRLEVTQNTTAYCTGPDVDVGLLTAAAVKLAALGVDRSKVVIIAQATLSVMDVSYLQSISNHATGVATPIVNFGGSNFSENSGTKTSYFVSLITTPLSQTLGVAPGTSIPASAVPTPVSTGAHAAFVISSPAGALETSLVQNPAIIQNPAQFKASLAASMVNPEIRLTH